MRRDEAVRYIGKQVHNGEYIGELVNITDDKPFRANIKVQAILIYPSLFDHNMSMRFYEEALFPICAGNIIQCGAKNLYAYKGESLSYEQSLISAIEKYEANARSYINDCQKAGKNIYNCYWGHDSKNAEKLLAILQEHRKILVIRSENEHY